MKVYKQIIRLHEQLFPSVCSICDQQGQPGIEICHACADHLPVNRHACRRCATPLAGDGPLVCGNCQQSSPCFDHTLAPLIYREPVDKLIWGLKFRDKLRYANLLVELFMRYRQMDSNPELLIPLPLHSSRTRQRGYNQALELTRLLSRKTGIRFDKSACIRTRPTAAQSTLTMKERKNNIYNAFTVTGPVGAEHVAIVDDVLTSGHTANELARVLKKSGVKRVDVWVMARTPTTS